MKTKQRYQVGVGDTHSIFDSFEAALAAKGVDAKKLISNLKARHTFSYRARSKVPRVFTGKAPLWSPAGVGVEDSPALEDLAAANDIAGYVKAWRKLNRLTD